jgi:hypothetical protein
MMSARLAACVSSPGAVGRRGSPAVQAHSGTQGPNKLSFVPHDAVSSWTARQTENYRSCRCKAAIIVAEAPPAQAPEALQLEVCFEAPTQLIPPTVLETTGRIVSSATPRPVALCAWRFAVSR